MNRHQRNLLYYVVLSTCGLLTQNLQAFDGGTGHEDDPYRISTVSHLQEITNEPAACYRMVEHVNASATEGWNFGKGFSPIEAFSGHFDGNGYTINSLFINSDVSQIGLFGTCAGGEIRDLNLANVNITGNGQVGAVVGMLSSHGIVSNCTVLSGIVQSSADDLGGLVGRIEEGSVVDCISEVNIEQPLINNVGGLVGWNSLGGIIRSIATGRVFGYYRVGGLVGRTSRVEPWKDPGYVIDCRAYGEVRGYRCVGGLAGFNGEDYWGGSAGPIEGCVASGDVYGSSEVGGLVGSQQQSSLVRCKALGGVHGTNTVGGLLGGQWRASVNECSASGSVVAERYVGGLVGSNNGTVMNSFATGSVTANFDDLGGLVGYNGAYGDIRQSYAAGNVSGRTDIGGLVGTSYYDMRNREAGSIICCYAVGNVIPEIEDDDDAGGLLGERWSSVEISNCYFTDSHTNGSGTLETSGVAAFYAQSHQVYHGSQAWDFETIWDTAGETCLPRLRRLLPPADVRVYASTNYTHNPTGTHTHQFFRGETVHLPFTIESNTNVDIVVWANIAPSTNHNANAIVAYLDSGGVLVTNGQNQVELTWPLTNGITPGYYDVIASVRLSSDTYVVLDTTYPGTNNIDFTDAAWLSGVGTNIQVCSIPGSGNGIWLPPNWIQTDKTSQYISLFDFLKERKISYIYLNHGMLSDLGTTLSGFSAPYEDNFIQAATSYTQNNHWRFSVLAWINGKTPDAGDPEWNLAVFDPVNGPTVRSNIACICAQVLNDADYDGIHLDIEPILNSQSSKPTQRPDFEDLLTNHMRASYGIGSNAILSVAVPGWGSTETCSWEWHNEDFIAVSDDVDQMIPMAYETPSYLTDDYPEYGTYIEAFLETVVPLLNTSVRFNLGVSVEERNGCMNSDTLREAIEAVTRCDIASDSRFEGMSVYDWLNGDSDEWMAWKLWTEGEVKVEGLPQYWVDYIDPNIAPYSNDCMIVSACALMTFWDENEHDGTGPYARLIDTGDTHALDEVPMWAYDQLTAAIKYYDPEIGDGVNATNGRLGILRFCNESVCGNQYDFMSTIYSFMPGYSNVSWRACTREVHHGRPFIICLQGDAPNSYLSNHAFPCVGYRNDGGTNRELIVHDLYGSTSTLINFDEYTNETDMSMITLVPTGFDSQSPPVNPSGVWSDSNGVDTIAHWRAVENALLYRVYRSTNEYYGFTVVGVADHPATVFTNTGTGSTRYYYVVTAKDTSFVESGPSNKGSATDSDSDSLPDSWELSEYGTLFWDETDDPDCDGQNSAAEKNSGTDPKVNPTNDDLDGDGHSNYEEAITGTNPYIGSEVFTELIGVDATGNAVILWDTVGGRLYTLKRCGDLCYGDWVGISGYVDIEGDGNPMSYVCEDGEGICQFFRVLVRLP